MTSSSEIPRFIALAVALGGVASCSGSGRMPPEPIGYVAAPRPPRHELILEGRVEDPPVAGQYQDPMPLSMDSGTGDPNYGYGDVSSDFAGADPAMRDVPATQNAYGLQRHSAPMGAITDATTDQGLMPPPPPADGFGVASTGPGTHLGASPASADSAAGMSGLPSEGVNMDAGLGIGAAAPTGEEALPLAGDPAPAGGEQLLSPPPPGSHFTIAEDNPSQPVVDGIGTDDPIVLVPRR